MNPWAGWADVMGDLIQRRLEAEMIAEIAREDPRGFTRLRFDEDVGRASDVTLVKPKRTATPWSGSVSINLITTT